MGILITAGSLLSVGTSMANVVYKLWTGGIKLASTVLNSKAGRTELNQACRTWSYTNKS